MKERKSPANNVVDQKEVWKKKTLKIGEEVVVEMMNATERKVDPDSEETMTTSLKKKKKGVLEDGEIAKSVKWINGGLPKKGKMTEEEIEIVIWTVLAHHEEVLMQEDGDVMTKEMIDHPRIETEIGEEIGVEEDLMIVTVMLKEVLQEGEEKVKIVGDVQMIETIEAHLVEIGMGHLVEIGMGHLVEEEMIVVLVTIEAQEVIIVALEGVTIVGLEETTAVEEMTVVLPIGGLDRENLIETISLRWEIVTAAMIVGVAVRVETAGDQDLEWVTEIKEVQEAVVLQQRISQEVVTNQQMGKTENGKLSANVNESFYFHRKCISNL